MAVVPHLLSPNPAYSRSAVLGEGKSWPPPQGLCIFMYLFWLGWRFFFLFPLNRKFRKVTSFLIPDSLWALKKILDNTEQLRCHFNSSFK